MVAVSAADFETLHVKVRYENEQGSVVGVYIPQTKYVDGKKVTTGKDLLSPRTILIEGAHLRRGDEMTVEVRPTGKSVKIDNSQVAIYEQKPSAFYGASSVIVPDKPKTNAPAKK